MAHVFQMVLFTTIWLSPLAQIGGRTSQGDPRPDMKRPDMKPTNVIREGNRLADQMGTFRVTGERITFFQDGGSQSFRVLENLLLERVARTLASSRERRQWTVSGRLTEFRGENFLLLERVVRKKRTDALAPAAAQ